MAPTGPFGASEEAFAAASETSALGWVYREAEANLGYPAAFIHHDIGGRVEASLTFSEAGAFFPALLSVHATSPYLRVYVYRLLEQTFRDHPIPESFRRWPGPLHVNCFVDFSRADGHASLVAKTTPILGHKLFFIRSSGKTATDTLTWKAGPLHGMLPVPAVGVDVLWFAQQAKQALHPSAPEDDLAPYRADPLFYN